MLIMKAAHVEGIWGLSIPSTQFCYKPKTAAEKLSLINRLNLSFQNKDESLTTNEKATVFRKKHAWTEHI